MDNIMGDDVGNSNLFKYINRSQFVKDNPEFFLTLFQSMPVNINVLNCEFEVIMCNESSFTLFGCESETEYLNNFTQLSPLYQPNGVASADQFSEYLTDAFENGGKTFDWLHCDLSGNAIPTTITLLHLNVSEHKEEDVLVGFIQDERLNTAEKETELAFNKKLEAILDATPLCLNVWNSEHQNIMCNHKAVTLFELKNEQQYLDEFFKLSPKYQPNGKLSKELVMINIEKAFNSGYVQFKWLHCRLDGMEIPTEIILTKIGIKDDDGFELVAGFTRDLRGELAGNDELEEKEIDDYFLNHISDKRLFKSLATLADELFFAADIRTSNVQYFGQLREKLGFNAAKNNAIDSLYDNDTIFEDDIPILMQLIQDIKNGITKPVDLRLNYEDKIPRYFRIVYKIIFDKEQNPIFVVGKIISIHKQKELEIQAKTDLLTNCYNKITTEAEITSIIEEGTEAQQHVFFIVDIDNFKAVNDSLGHHFGDLVLSEVATNLKACFRSQDIVGRIGGDEFIGFAKDLSDMNVLIKKAETIANAFHNTYSGENADYKISGSIGVARYPLDGTSYSELYKAADKAMYQSKKKGKDCYTFFNNEFALGTMRNRTMLENASRMANSYFDAEIISTVFHLLYETNDITSSINAVLKFLGKRLNVDRCYIFETFDRGENYSNTYEWCTSNTTSEIMNLQNLTKELLSDFLINSSTEGIVYSNDLSVLEAEGAFSLMADQDIKSFLHAQFKRNDIVKGFLGVDDCSAPRVWSDKEINSILYSAKTISTFLLIANERAKTIQSID